MKLGCRGRGSPARRAMLGSLIVALAAACGPADRVQPTEVSPEAMDGLIVLDQGGRGSELHVWVDGEGGAHPLPVEVDPDAEQLATSLSGRVAVLAPGGRLLVSAPLVASGPLSDPAWREVVLTLAEPPPFEATTFASPAWDPTGTRMALLAEAGSSSAIAEVNPDTGAARLIGIPGAQAAMRPVWLNATTLAVAIPEVPVSDPSADASLGVDLSFHTVLVDVVTGDMRAGPARVALASSPDGRLVVTADRLDAPAPLAVQDTDAWLSGSSDAIATIDAPPDVLVGPLVAFDSSGSRIAVAWWLADVPRDGQMQVRVYRAAEAWSSVAQTGAAQSWFADIGWLPSQLPLETPPGGPTRPTPTL